MRNKEYKLWHAIAFYAAVNASSWVLKMAAKFVGQPRKEPIPASEDRELYRRENLPFFAPPGAAFPIAWTINSISALSGALRVLNLRRSGGRTKFLRWQAAAWALYSTFEAAYFGLRSPINAALVTVLYTIATGASIMVALRDLRDPKIALSLATTALWLALANPLGITQALWNRDPFWKIGPFAHPPERWLKAPRDVQAS